MSDAIDLHNALREHGLLPAHLDLKFSQCPMKHCELMAALEDELGLGHGQLALELQIECEALESQLRETRRELESVERHDADLDKEYRRVCSELETLKASAAQ